uniref:Uncharacterized protein n=1 Tax=Plectus sambesii TaxID=2011161 RepID=A0A914W156_9BILA
MEEPQPKKLHQPQQPVKPRQQPQPKKLHQPQQPVKPRQQPQPKKPPQLQQPVKPRQPPQPKELPQLQQPKPRQPQLPQLNHPLVPLLAVLPLQSLLPPPVQALQAEVLVLIWVAKLVSKWEM